MLNKDELDYILNDLYGFYAAFVITKDYTKADHIKSLSKELMNIEDGGRLVVNIPPRHSKSSLITLAYPIFEYLHNKDCNIVIVTSTMTLAEKFGITIKEWFNQYGALFDCFKSDIKHSKTHLMFENSNGDLYEGSIRLTSAGSTLTGLDVDIIILDDIYKGYADTTPSLLEKKIDWFNTIVLQRLEPHSKLLILHTRWAENDLTGYLKANHPNDYKFIELPAINEDGKVLWHERYDKQFFTEREQEIGERMFSALYQQKPLDETGNFFDLNRIDFNHAPQQWIIASVRSWDLAYSDESKGDINDSTAGVLMKKTIDGYYIITDLQHGQYGDNIKNKLKETAYLDRPNTSILIETGTSGGASKFYFNELKDSLQGYRVSQSEPKGTKVDRAMPFKDAILDGRVIVDLNDSQREAFIKELTGFPLAKHDDIVDACSYAYLYLRNIDTNRDKMTGHRRKRIERL